MKIYTAQAIRDHLTFQGPKPFHKLLLSLKVNTGNPIEFDSFFNALTTAVKRGSIQIKNGEYSSNWSEI